MNKATRMALMSHRNVDKTETRPTQERTYYGDSEARFHDWTRREHLGGAHSADDEAGTKHEKHKPHVAPSAHGMADVDHEETYSTSHAADDDLELTEEMARDWMANLKNEDGTTGPHWTIEQTTQVMKQKGVDCDPVEFWVAMNAMYSDYFNVAKKMNVNNVDFYVQMAKAFIDDKDAGEGKLMKYYEYITE